jgi:hypothetical protein
MLRATSKHATPHLLSSTSTCYHEKHRSTLSLPQTGHTTFKPVGSGHKRTSDTTHSSGHPKRGSKYFEARLHQCVEIEDASALRRHTMHLINASKCIYWFDLHYTTSLQVVSKHSNHTSSTGTSRIVRSMQATSIVSSPAVHGSIGSFPSRSHYTITPELNLPLCVLRFTSLAE